MVDSGNISRPPQLAPRAQADATLDQVAVQNTWYTVLEIKRPIRAYIVRVSMETLAEDIECKVTIDGLSYSGAQPAAVAGTGYMWNIYVHLDTVLAPSTGVVGLAPGGLTFMDVNNLKVEVRKTTANGANHLFARVKYGLW